MFDNERKVMQSYIYTEKYGNFFVSTMYRRSSGINEVFYYEVYAWKLNDKNERTKWIVEESGYLTHFEVCKQLQDKGEYKRNEEE